MLYLPYEYNTNKVHYPVIYVNGEDNISDIMCGIEPHLGMDCDPFILLSIQSENWNNDYTPWSAPALTKKEDNFGGCASSYLCILINFIKPYIDEHYRTKPEPKSTTIIGYSLGGLATLYALYTTKTFGRFGSLSGSLWYDGWIEFMECNMPANIESKVYLSLGKSEERSRNQRMAKVGNCTRKTVEILSKQLKPENVTLEWNNGGHFTEIPYRFQRALTWLMQSDEKHM